MDHQDVSPSGGVGGSGDGLLGGSGGRWEPSASVPSQQQQPIRQPHGQAGGCSSSSAGPSLVTLPIAMQMAMDQCEARGLQPTAQWLSELLLSASQAITQDAVYPIPLDSPSTPSVSSAPPPPAVRTMAVLGRSLLSNKEYVRCFDALRSAIPSVATSCLEGECTGGGVLGTAGGVGVGVAGGGGSTTMSTLRAGTFGRSLSSIRPYDSVGVDDDYVASTIGLASTALGGGAVAGNVGGGGGATPLHHQNTMNGIAGGSQWRRGGGPDDSSSSPAVAADLSSVAPPQVYGNTARATAQQGKAGSPPAIGEPATHSPLLAFMCLYALYMDGQQHRAVSPIASRSQMNPNLAQLRILIPASLEWYPQDAFLYWLHGVVLRESQLKHDAAVQLLHSVRLNPFLWCAWLDLATLVTKESQLVDISAALRGLVRADALLMFRFFSACVRADLGYHTAAATDWDSLLHSFPSSSFIKCHIGNCMYNRKDFDRAREYFEDVRRVDPYRLESTDDYSNVLFVRGDRVGLSVLAQQCYALDAYRAETNCIVGNYFSIIGRHDKSLFYFRRAVTIDPKYLSGWTLMGHEYLEMKNTNAAVEAYRTAVEIDQRDYRAWYGLGQIYELLHMHHHALYYYWQTTTLRPTDPRMWGAVANCLEQDRRPNEAVSCLERAEQYEPSMSDHYPSLVRRIAEYYIGIHNMARAKVFLEKLVGCERRRAEDLLFAVPCLVDAVLSELQDVFAIPTRSPSFDPHGRLSGGVLPSSSAQQQGRPSGELRKREGTHKLDQCEQLLTMLLHAAPLTDEEATANTEGEARGGVPPSAGGAGGGGGPHRVQRYVSQTQSTIAYMRNFIASAPTAAM